MPIRSARQWRAMAAAAHGHSNLGIPSGVAEEMIHKTPKKKRKRFASARPTGLLSRVA
jgi:hypothetical protein